MTATARKSMRLAAPEKKVRPLDERGRLLFVADILKLLPTKPDGSPVKGAWWVKHHFAPEHKHKLGRDYYWWEADALEWLDGGSR